MKIFSMKRITAWILTMVMLLGMLPLGIFAAEAETESVVVIAGSDYQESNSSTLMTNIMKQIKEDYSAPYGALLGGDYDAGKTTSTAALIEDVDDDIDAVFPGILADNRIYLQGNHESWSNLNPGNGNLLTTTGAHDTEYYGVYAINHADFPWYYSNPTESLIKATAESLDAYLDAKVAEAYDKPIFVMSHLPLHYSTRTYKNGDSKYAKYLYDVLDAAGDAGLNIIFLFGHNHSSTYDDYLGGGQIYLGINDTITIAENGSKTSYFTDKLSFTYMNYGYLGYIGGQAGTNLSMTTFEIDENEVIIKRYGTNGPVELKAAGKTTSNAPPADTSVVGAEGVVIALGTPSEPDIPVDPEEPIVPDEPVEPDEPESPVAGIIWRKASSIENGKNYMLVNYGYNASGVGTYAVDSSASPFSVIVKTDDTGAYIVNDDMSLAWTANANNAQFEMTNADTGYYLRSSSYAYNSSGSNLSVSASVSSGSTYSNWSLETKSGNQVLAVRRATSSNYYPVRYTGSAFQSFNSSNVSSMTNWLAVFVETEETAHTHVYEATVVVPTCTDDGYTLYQCACGNSYTDDAVAALGHEYSTEVIAPTCTEAGYTIYTCTCGDSYTDNTIVALGHDYAVSVTDPTCTENGSAVYTCDCGDTYTEIIEAVGHDYECVITEADCENDGSEVYTCACGDTYTVVIPAIGHHYECVITEADCVNPGSKVYTCVCGDTYTEVIPKTEHTYEIVVTAPTCTQNGYTTYTCKCGDSYIADETLALGHTYSVNVYDPSCSKEGTAVYTCVCGDTYTETIPATGEHAYTSETVVPTCTENGSVVYVCDCGDTYTEELPALGHTYSTEVIAPTCTEAGYTVYTCACGDSYTDDVVAALGHDYIAEVIAPTCEEDGYTIYTCACGESYTDDVIAALGHDYTAEVIAPTCEEDGYTVYTCACGDSYTGDRTAALGHNYTAEEIDGYIVYTCSCGDSYSEAIEENLRYVKVNALGNDNYVITLTSGNKYYALVHTNNQISAVRVTVSNNEITSEITDDMIWNCFGNVLSYESNGTTYYLHVQTYGGWWGWYYTPTLTISTSSSTPVYLYNGKISIGGYYLRYSNNKISLNWSGSGAALFEETKG